MTPTFAVKVGLTNPPPTMRLGATVTGRMERNSRSVIASPATALTKFNSQPAVCIVYRRHPHRLNSQDPRVALRPGKGCRLRRATTGDVVVTAGVQALHPGQKVRLLGSEP